MRKYVLFLFKFIIFIKTINYCKLLSKCNKDNPFLKEEGCISSCTPDEIKNGECLIENEIIKTQWLNNIIYIGDKGSLYINVVGSEYNNLYLLSSSYPQSNIRNLFILNKEGNGIFNNNPFYNTTLDDKEKRGRFESEIFTIKLYTQNDDKEYLISMSHGLMNMEIYDFYENKIYFNTVADSLELISIFHNIFAHVKLNLYSKENKNIYLLGLLAHSFPSGVAESDLFLKKVSFTSLDIKNNPPKFETLKIKCSNSKMTSCYETSNNFIVCFFLNHEYKYKMNVFTYDLKQKTETTIANGNSNEGYEDLFFKCIHFFNESGAFGYFTNEENPVFVFQFKKYINKTNTISNTYNTFSVLKIDNYYFNKEYVSMCDMIKIEDKKLYFVGVSIDKNILYIIFIMNYYNENFIQRIYSINSKNLYNYQFSYSLKITLYKKFLVLGSSFSKELVSYSSLMIFSYPNTTNASLDIHYYLSNNKNIKIYNLTLELNGEYIMENNIFGYIYSGFQIINNCIKLEDIYLANLDDKKIDDDYFIPKNKKIKLYIPKNDIYEPFTCQIKYAVVVTEPEYSEYNKYPTEIIDTGVDEKENIFFDNNKNNYIGRYSFYNLTLKYKLTEICKNNCELCYYYNNSKCITCQYINKNNNECLEECNSTNFFNNICRLNNNSIELMKDEMTNNIQNDLENGLMDPLIDNVINKKKEDLIIKEDDVVYQITSTENQNNNKNNSVSTIILGECENILKRIYKIDENKALLIFKIEYYKIDSLIPIIGYEIYHPDNKSKLDLTYCKNELINFNIPVNIDEDNLIKYDPNSEYYTDDCYPYTTENGTDILISDRQEEYNDNNMSLCENNCTYNGYKNDTKEAKCECNIKSKQLVISEIINQTDILYYSNFTNQSLSTNIISMKCYYTLFSKEGLLTNIGSYVLFSTIILFLISIIIFFKCGYALLENDMEAIISFKENSKKENVQNNIYIPKRKNKKSKTMKIKDKEFKRGKKKRLTYIKQSNSKINTHSNNIFIYQKEKLRKSHEINNHKKLNNLIYNDFELNALSYIEALKYDKRTYFNFYIYLLKTKNPFIFSFFPIKDYNSKIIKIDLFFLSFNIYYVVNALFFNESIIHKIYENKGVYNISYLIPYIIFSFIISYIICNIIKYIILSERIIYQIEYEEDINKARDKMEKVKKIIFIKYICFYAIGLTILFLFWYYLSSFNAVYQNTQVYIIKNTLICFSFSLVYPFIIILLPDIFRIFSLKNSNRECIYKASQIFEYL